MCRMRAGIGSLRGRHYNETERRGDSGGVRGGGCIPWGLRRRRDWRFLLLVVFSRDMDRDRRRSIGRKMCTIILVRRGVVRSLVKRLGYRGERRRIVVGFLGLCIRIRCRVIFTLRRGGMGIWSLRRIWIIIVRHSTFPQDSIAG